VSATVTVGREATAAPVNVMGMMADMARRLREQTATRETLVEILESIVRVVGVQAATLYLLNRRTGQLDPMASSGPTVDLLHFVQFERGRGLTGWVAQQKRPVCIRGRDPERNGVRDHHDSVMIVPLSAGEELLGVICFSHPDRDAFDADTQELLEVVAGQVAISLERVFYHSELEAGRRALAAAQEQIDATRERAASVGRDIADPAAAIMGNAQIIELETAHLPEDIRRRVHAVIEGAKRISLLTHQLLKSDGPATERRPPEANQTTVDTRQSAGEGHDRN
jgi:transcriptional regulator with GAF, ATPase, and Fis domain